MTPTRTLLGAVLALSVGACATSPPVHYVTLDDGRPSAVRSPDGPRVAVTQVNLPDLVDRPQLVMRTVGHQVQFNDQYEWAEPLRRQIPLVIAHGLDEALNSGSAMALPIDAQDSDVDFKVMLDIQRLEVISGRGVDLEVVWRVTSRDGGTFMERSRVWEPLEASSASSGYPTAVAAQNHALRTVAASIAMGINRCLSEMAKVGASRDAGDGSTGLFGGQAKKWMREPSR